MHSLSVCEPSGLGGQVKSGWRFLSLCFHRKIATLQLLIFLFFSFTVLTRAALHVQLGEEPGAAGGEGGKRASSGLIDLSQLQLTSFNKK